MVNSLLRKGSIIMVAVVLAVVLAACGSNNDTKTENNASSGSTNEPAADNTAQEEPAQDLSGEIKIDGSSTVYPISQAVAEEFMVKNGGVNVTVNLSGSGNGAKKLIAGEIDIADMSRKMKDEEHQQLKDKGDDGVEMPVAYDGITVVIHPENDWAKEMTVAELKKVWEKGSTVKKWSDIRPEWPNEEIHLYGPGTASGTFEYFTKAINGEEKVSREDYTPSEDDNVLVTGVAGDKYAMGYFGFAYYEENMDKLHAVSIKADDAAPAVAPAVETIKDGSYTPLSRPIFIYPSKKALERPEIQAFVKFYMSEEGQALTEEVGYVRLQPDKYEANIALLP